jgi:hypothetical protein
MSELDKMTPEQIREYLEKNKFSLGELRDFYSHEMNNKLRPEVVEIFHNFMTRLGEEGKQREPVKRRKL